jgi:hypothetical protein
VRLFLSLIMVAGSALSLFRRWVVVSEVNVLWVFDSIGLEAEEEVLESRNPSDCQHRASRPAIPDLRQKWSTEFEPRQSFGLVYGRPFRAKDWTAAACGYCEDDVGEDRFGLEERIRGIVD